MGERKGQNKYYPPDYDPKKGGLNKFLGTHALRERARKIHLGIIIIRFEMPYNIWCDGCNKHIGMGVRYNAQKTKIGNYYSTTIYQFRMKCHLCDNHFEIKTDPANLDYIIVSGARRQENRWDPTTNEQIVPETKETQRKLFDDPMYKLEHQIKDLQKGEHSKPVIAKLYERNLDRWQDNYEANCKLRSTFRAKKKELKIQQEKDKALLAKCSLDIDLLPETEQDKKMAALMKLQSRPAKEIEEEKRLDVLTKPALPSSTPTTFAGLKRHKLINSKLYKNDLGIKRKKSETLVITENTKITNDSNSTKLNNDKNNVETTNNNIEGKIENSKNDKSETETDEKESNSEKLILKGCQNPLLSTGLSLVLDYTSSDSNTDS